MNVSEILRCFAFNQSLVGCSTVCGKAVAESDKRSPAKWFHLFCCIYRLPPRSKNNYPVLSLSVWFFDNYLHVHCQITTERISKYTRNWLNQPRKTAVFHGFRRPNDSYCLSVCSSQRHRMAQGCPPLTRSLQSHSLSRASLSGTVQSFWCLSLVDHSGHLTVAREIIYLKATLLDGEHKGLSRLSREYKAFFRGSFWPWW